MTLLTQSDYVRMPWLNGGGYATEFAKVDVAPPQHQPGDTFVWRLSDADIDSSGPFSNYQGIDRYFMIFEGNGVVLDFAEHGQARVDRKYRFHHFDGGWKTDCTLIDGPAKAFNLQTAQRLVDVRHKVIEAGAAPVEETLPAAGAKTTRLVFILTGTAVATVGGKATSLPTRATLILDGGSDALTLSGRGFVAAVIDILPKP